MTDLTTTVMYAPMIDIDITEPLVPNERYQEVLRCKSEKTRQEKYLVWKLLEHAVKKRFDIDFVNVRFTKTENGKWICPDFYFSLSHTDGAVCVAVSNVPVGVDIERVRELKPSIAARFLSDEERARAMELGADDASRFFLECWVKKESIFKKSGAESLLPAKIDTLQSDARAVSACVRGEKYLIAIDSDADENYEIIYTEDL